MKVFLRRGDCLLVLRDRKQQRGDLPGGRLGAGEIYRPWPEALQRELNEELGDGIGYSLDSHPLFIFPHYIQESGYEALGIAFGGELLSGEPQLSAEHDQCWWRQLAGYDPSIDFSDHLLEAVQIYLRLRR
ncbi:MAG: NUDIX hydrolase [Leptospirales bacterium]|nr:NUDIX hydrolase [Leptospirales bacterium]